MKRVTTEQSTHTQDSIETNKTAYNRPDLRVYGSVKTLTKGGNGTLADGNNTTKKK